MKIPNWHNPENAPDDKLPQGWRFLTVEEREENDRTRTLRKLRSWDADNEEWNDPGTYLGNDDTMTYCTDAPLPPEYQEAPKEVLATSPEEKIKGMEARVTTYASATYAALSQVKGLEEKCSSLISEKLQWRKQSSQWLFLKSSKCVTFQNPEWEDSPEGMKPKYLTMSYGVIPGLLELSEDGKLKYNDGREYEMKNVLSVIC